LLGTFCEPVAVAVGVLVLEPVLVVLVPLLVDVLLVVDMEPVEEAVLVMLPDMPLDEAEPPVSCTKGE
jgi:hypothetical protein